MRFTPRSAWKPISMRLPARCLLAAALLSGAVSPAVRAAEADAYPNRPIRFIISQAAGGNADYVARAYANRLGERLGQQIVIDNRPGAGGLIASEIVARAAPDGYTWLLASTPHATNPSLIRKLPYDTRRDFTPVSQLGVGANLLVLNNNVAARSVAEVVALAKAKPGRISSGSSGVGNSPHLTLELFNVMAGVKILHVPYKGATAALVDLVGGQIEMMFASMPSALPLARGGKLRMLAVSTIKRSAIVPDLPTVAEAGVPGFDTAIFQALLLPAKAPQSLVDRLHREVAAIAKQPEMRERLMTDGAEPVGGTPKELADFIDRELEKWAKVAKIAGMQPQ